MRRRKRLCNLFERPGCRFSRESGSVLKSVCCARACCRPEGLPAARLEQASHCQEREKDFPAGQDVSVCVGESVRQMRVRCGGERRPEEERGRETAKRPLKDLRFHGFQVSIVRGISSKRG